MSEQRRPLDMRFALNPEREIPMGLRDFGCWNDIRPVRSNGRGMRKVNQVVIVQTPLTAGGSVPHVGDIGWVTQATFFPLPRHTVWNGREDNFRRVANIIRLTTPVITSRGGLRRKLKFQPITRDEYDVWTQGYGGRSTTRWRHDAFRFKEDSAYDIIKGGKLSFFHRLGDLYAILATIREQGDAPVGQPLVDWVMEFAPEVATIFDSAGWIPKSNAELRKADRERTAKRAEERARIDAARREFDSAFAANHPVNTGGTDDEGDRWR